MMDEKSLTKLTHEIMAQGYDEQTASDYAVLIGDTPCMDDHNNVIVRKHGRQIAKLKPLEFFGTLRPIRAETAG
jgi:hypothetical protein